MQKRGEGNSHPAKRFYFNNLAIDQITGEIARLSACEY
jgi:hypothetical protein